MLLREFLAEADENTTYFIGGGSGYLTIGTPEEIDLHNLSEQKKQHLALNVHEAEQKVETAKNRLEQAENELRITQNKLKQAERNLISAKRKFKEFVPFAEREVTKTYISPCYGNHCVIIQGNENGEFWTERERQIKESAQLITAKIMNGLKELVNTEGLSEKNAAAAIAECLSELKYQKVIKGENE